MNEAVRKELEQAGGVVRTEGPDANGITTYHAADGTFVAVGPDGNPRMRGYAPPDGSTQTPSAAPAAPPTSSGGGGMNQQQVEQWIAANGGAGAVQYNSGSKRIKNPARSMTNADGSDNPNYDPTAPEWIDITEESWTNSKTGATLRVSRRPGGDFDVVENKGADPQRPSNPDAQTAKPPETKDEGGRRWVWQPNPGGPNAGGKWVDAGAAPLTPAERAAAEADADRNRPKPEPDGRGGWGYWDTTKTPPQWTPITTGGPAGEQPKPVEINGKWGVWKPGPDGVPVWTPVNAPPEQRAPAETGSFIPDRTKPALGLVEHVQRLAQLRAQGKLTDKQYNEAIATAEAMAAAEGKRLDAQISAQQTAASQAITQRGQDISASTARLGQANAATREAFDQGTKWASAMTPSSYKAAGGPLYSAVMVAQDARAGNWGGMYQPPQVTTAGYPAWDSLVRADPNPSGAYVASQNAAITGQAGALLQGAATPPPPAAPAAPLPAPLIRPNAPVISPPPTAGEPGGPPLAPGPVYGGPSTPNPATPNLYPPPPSPPAQQPAMPQPLLPPSPTTPNLYPNPTNGGWDEPTPPPPAGAPTWDTYRPPPISSPAGGNVQLAPFTAPAFGAMDPRISRVMGNVPQGMDPNEWANYVMEAARLEGVA